MVQTTARINSPNTELMVQLANRFINILDVKPIYEDNVLKGYLVEFEYKFKTLNRDGWHKYTVEAYTPTLVAAYLKVYEYVTAVQDELKGALSK